MIRAMRRQRRRRVVTGTAVVCLLGLGTWRGPGMRSSTWAAQPPVRDVTFRIIVVSSGERAAQVVEQLRRGAGFAALERRESIDPSAAQGGLVGPIALAELRPEIRDALSGLGPGEISAVLRVPTGFAVVQPAGPAMGSPARGAEIPALAAVGSVRSTLSVDGFAEADNALDTIAKSGDWNQSPRTICELRRKAVAAVKAALARRLGPDAADTNARFTPYEVMEAHVALGQLHAYGGEMAEAIAEFERARRMAIEHVPAAVADFEQMLGVARLHKAALDAGLHREPGDRCLLSLASGTGARPGRTADFDLAVGAFAGRLARQPDDLEARWLLNAAFMTAGGYPALVPLPHRIPADAFRAAEDVGRFVDVAAASGVHSFSSAGGVVVDDFDNDGRLDILTSNFDSCGPMQLFRRAGDGTFVERAAQAGLAGQLGGLNPRRQGGRRQFHLHAVRAPAVLPARVHGDERPAEALREGARARRGPRDRNVRSPPGHAGGHGGAGGAVAGRSTRVALRLRPRRRGRARLCPLRRRGLSRRGALHPHAPDGGDRPHRHAGGQHRGQRVHAGAAGRPRVRVDAEGLAGVPRVGPRVSRFGGWRLET